MGIVQAQGQQQVAWDSRDAAIENVRAAQALLRHNRRRGLAALNGLFRAGAPPNTPLDGRYAGELIALDLAPGLTQFAAWLARRWMPWR